MPVFTGTMGRSTFLLSGGLAVVAFVLVLFVLRTIGADRLRKAWWGIVMGAAGVFAVVNVFYFTNILPPLPLALSYGGVFHSVTKDGETYRAVAEPQTADNLVWSLAATAPVMRVQTGGSLSVYSAVFAPIQLKTNVVHRWRRYDETARHVAHRIHREVSHRRRTRGRLSRLFDQIARRRTGGGASISKRRTGF